MNITSNTETQEDRDIGEMERDVITEKTKGSGNKWKNQKEQHEERKSKKTKIEKITELFTTKIQKLPKLSQ